MSRRNSRDSQILRRQCLKPNAVPRIFPNLPAYLSSTPTTSRPTSCSSSSARLELENAKIQSLNKAILLGDTIPNFDALKEKLNAETWPERFLRVNKGSSVQFYYRVNDDTSEPPQLLASVIIPNELALRAYVHEALLPLYIYKHILPSKYLTKVLQLANVLALCKSLTFDKNATSSAKSEANLVLIAAAILEKCV